MEGTVDLFPRAPDHLASGKIVVYFENDIPRPAPTIPAYDITYNRYLAVRNEYIRGSVNQRVDLEKLFEDVDLGMSNLRDFAAYIYDNIGNNRLEIFLRGHASPRSNPIYNEALSERRNQSIRNFLLGWEGGKLSRYFYEGSIRINAIPFGDTRAVPGVSSSYEDRARSVYSVEASRERRVELFWNWKEGNPPRGLGKEGILEQVEIGDGEGKVPLVVPREAATHQVIKEGDPVQAAPVVRDGDLENEPKADKWFYVIVGSYSTAKLAERHTSRLQSAGHSGAGVVSSLDGRQHRVYVKRYPSQQAAMGELGQYRTKISPDAWVYNQ